MTNIRKVQAPKVAKKQQEEALAEHSWPVLKIVVDQAFKKGDFTAKDSQDLASILKRNPALKAPLKEYIETQIADHAAARADFPLPDKALTQLGQSVGLDLKGLFNHRQAQSEVVDRDVAQGLEKTAKTAADEHDAGQHKKASDARNAKTQALLDGKNGVERVPLGKLDNSAFKAGAALTDYLEGKVDAQLSPDLLDAKNFLKAPLIEVSQNVLATPEVQEQLGALKDAIGTPEFTAALGKSASTMGRTIADAAGFTTVNVANVDSAVAGLQSCVERLGVITKGGPLEKVVAENAPKLAKGAAALGAKLTAGAKVAKAGADAAKIAEVGADAAKVAKVAQTAGVVAKGAQVGVAGAEAAGQAVPGANIPFGIALSGAAAVEFGGNVMHKPRSPLKILASLGNVVGQIVGIFVPGIGAAVTGAKFVADRAIAHHEKKKGIESGDPLTLKDVAPHVDQMTNMLTAYCDGAGHESTSARLRTMNAQVKAFADKGMTSADVAKMTPEEREALEHTMRAVNVDVKKVAEDFKGTPMEAAFHLAGQGVSALIAVLRKARTVESDVDKKKLAGEAMKAAATVAAAQAAGEVADKTGG